MRARIITNDGWKTVRCVWRKRGLAVTKAWDASGWTVTHTATGRSIGRWTSEIANPHKAIAIAIVLSSAVDWRQIREPIPAAHANGLDGFVRAVLEMFEVIPS